MKLEWVKPTKDVPECVIEALERGVWRSSYHLRNSLKIIGWPAVSIEIWSTVTAEEGTEEAIEDKDKYSHWQLAIAAKMKAQTRFWQCLWRGDDGGSSSEALGRWLEIPMKSGFTNKNWTLTVYSRYHIKVKERTG